MCKFRLPSAIAITLVSLWTASPATGHGAHVLLADLQEQPHAHYQLRLTIQDEILQGAALTPQFPTRCQLTRTAPPEPAPQQLEPATILVFEFDCDGQALTRTDRLTLPWPVGGGLVVAHWQDGSTQKQFFPPVAAGVTVEVGQLMPEVSALFPQLQADLLSGLMHIFWGWNHLLLWLSVAIWARSKGLLRLVLVFMGGQMGAIALLTLPISTGSLLLATEAFVALAAVLFAGLAVLNPAPTRLPRWCVLLIGALGTLHGLAWSNGLASPALLAGYTGMRLFAFSVGGDVGQLLVAAGLIGSLQLVRRWPQRQRLRLGMGWGVGAIALLAALFPQLHQGPQVHIQEIQATDPSADPSPTPPSPPQQPAALAPQPGSTQQFVSEPISGFVTIAPMAVRYELLLRVQTLRDQPKSGLSHTLQGKPVLAVAEQANFKQQVKAVLKDAIALKIDNTLTPATATQINFVSADTTGIFNRDEPIPEAIDEAVIGVVLTYPTTTLPETVSVTWNWFFPQNEAIPTAFTDPQHTQKQTLTPEQAIAQWRNTLTDFVTAPITTIAIEPAVFPLSLVALLIVGGALVGDIVVLPKRQPNWPQQFMVTRLLLPLAILAYPLAVLPLPLPWQPQPSSPQVALILDQLLTNIYRSFEFRDEEAIYDKLALSMEGEQLTETYLENRRAFEVENQGGARAQVDQVDVTKIYSVSQSPNQNLVVQAEWRAGGSVSHFGHTHYRYNLYFADITLTYADQVWKIKNIDLKDELRLL